MHDRPTGSPHSVHAWTAASDAGGSPKRAWDETIAGSRATYNGVETRVLSVAGRGTLTVMLHGFADSADTWRGMLTQFQAAGRSAMAVDLPGFGRAAERPHGPMLPIFDDFAAALINRHAPVVLVGNSLGAATAVRAASRSDRDKVRAVVAISDPLNVNHWIARQIRRCDYPPLFFTLGVAPFPDVMIRWGVQHAVRRLLFGPDYDATPEVIRQWLATLATRRCLSLRAREAFQYARETRGGHGPLHLPCPCLILHGAKDLIIPVHSSVSLQRAIPGSDLVLLRKSGHCPQLDDPTALTTLVLNFVDRCNERMSQRL